MNNCVGCGAEIPEGRQVCPECETRNGVKVVVPGKPRGKERPRFGGHAYTPERTRTAERVIAWYYCMQTGHRVFETPVIRIKAIFEPPKSASKKTREAMLAGQVRPKVKPDWDNIGKLVCDALNGIAYKDDKDVVEATVKKEYGREARTEIYIREDGNE